MRHRAVIDQSDERRGNEFAYFALVHAGAFSNEVGFKAMTACFVEQHSTTSCLDHNRQRTRRSGAGLQLCERSNSCGPRHIFNLNLVK